jgi:hypothetical protein
MLDGQAYRAHFPDDPAYESPAAGLVPRLPKSEALLEALAALEEEFRTILARNDLPNG